ncbi:MAG: menaquinone biosynthesis protein [Chitinophagales bacterium]|nr:menaquinone biosynthesis protein [Chitinophagales bacterium]
MAKIKVAAVSYLNTKPFLFGIRHSPLVKEVELIIDHPSRIAEELIKGNADLGLVPVAVIPEIGSAKIISDYCIGCNGAVSSVSIYSEVPIWEVNEIFLDYQSRTSTELAKILVRNYWGIQPIPLTTFPGYEKLIANNRAGLIIGDRALYAKNKFQYSYDLGEAWKQYTGLPFVFACWIMNKELPSGFINEFNEALQFGIDHISEVAELEALNFPGLNIYEYFTKNIQFNLDAGKQEALKKFLFFIKEKPGVTV